MSLFAKIESIINNPQYNAALTSLLAQYGEDLQVETINSGARENTTITTIADVDKSLSGKYFITSNSEGYNFYVWYNIDNESLDPLVVNRIGIEVNISENDTANTIASKTLDELKQYFNCTLSTNVLIVNNVSPKSIPDTVDVNTGFSFIINKQGSNPNEQYEYINVYGVQGSVLEKKDTNIIINGIVVGDDWIVLDQTNHGTFKRGYLYTKSENIVPGYVLRIPRGQGEYRRYVIGLEEGLGTNMALRIRYTLESLQD